MVNDWMKVHGAHGGLQHPLAEYERVIMAAGEMWRIGRGFTLKLKPIMHEDAMS
jgi:hypothetical protein